ncbi:MAG: glycine--tRNA ligase subunit beta, partial [Gammaproteobacteria bacterium]|nr:glycine--tRNA ligase subunit beta [Phycisphaerae bacterium]NIQ08573.1 glycine--tRNA ligase subunit beta [Gammaproteobacteria bacterium]NIX26204.1 glycine--tRNA ligase subunit beta [Phycisphaerae bacterium]
PLRWLVALYGSEIIPFAYAAVLSGRTSQGLRLHGSPEIVVSQANRYLDEMASYDVVLQTSERKAVITTAAANLA